MRIKEKGVVGGVRRTSEIILGNISGVSGSYWVQVEVLSIVTLRNITSVRYSLVTFVCSESVVVKMEG